MYGVSYNNYNYVADNNITMAGNMVMFAKTLRKEENFFLKD